MSSDQLYTVALSCYERILKISYIFNTWKNPLLSRFSISPEASSAFRHQAGMTPSVEYV